MVAYDSSIKTKFLNNKTENNIQEVLKNINSGTNINSMNIYSTSSSDSDLIKSLGINNPNRIFNYASIRNNQLKSRVLSIGPSITNICVSGKIL